MEESGHPTVRSWVGTSHARTTGRATSLPRRFALLRRLGIPPDVQIDHEAGKALQRLVEEASRKAVQAALDALKAENDARYKWSPRLRRLLLRHVETAEETFETKNTPEDIFSVYIPSTDDTTSEASK